MGNFLRIVLTIIGTISIGVGIIGIFLPIMPSTPFFLLGAACYLRSSEKLYNKLINVKWIGKYISNYQQGMGIPLRAKIVSIAFLWTTISFSAIFVINNITIRIILLLIAISVTVHLIMIKTLKSDRM